jgi:hypothetical protein
LSVVSVAVFELSANSNATTTSSKNVNDFIVLLSSLCVRS